MTLSCYHYNYVRYANRPEKAMYSIERSALAHFSNHREWREMNGISIRWKLISELYCDAASGILNQHVQFIHENVKEERLLLIL